MPMPHYCCAPGLAHIPCCATGIGHTAGYADVDSLILIGKQSAAEAFTQNEACFVVQPMHCYYRLLNHLLVRCCEPLLCAHQQRCSLNCILA